MPILLCGLGNPGSEYATTRHNLGFMVVNELARRHRLAWTRPRREYHLACGPIGGVDVEVMQPRTYMNRSGRAIRAYVGEGALDPEQFLVITDDFELPLGRVRMRRSGSAGAHNGLTSIVTALGHDRFARLRLGIGPLPAGGDPADFVLEPFFPEEEEFVAAMVARAADAVEVFLAEGIEAAMNRFNRKAGDGGGGGAAEIGDSERTGGLEPPRGRGPA